MARAFGIDISKHQASSDGIRRMDFDAVRTHKEKVSFIASRAGVSWGYRDPQFTFHWNQSATLGVGRIAYHVLYFGESAIAQMDSLFKMLENQSNFVHDRIALDLEVAGINTRARITATTLNCLEICKSRTGRYPMVYSRASWVNTYLNVADMPKLDWWLATYNKFAPAPFYTKEHEGPPYLPKGVDTYLIHQTGDKCKSIGAQSHYMDYNRWNGDLEAVQKYFKYPTSGAVADPENKILFYGKCVINTLNKHDGPGSKYQTVGSLSLGELISVYEVRDGWYKISPSTQVWCSGEPKHIQRLAEVDPNKKMRAQCIVKALFKRNGPGSKFKIIGNLVRDDIVTIYEEKYGWYRISKDEQVWCSGESHYMRLLDI